MGVRALYTAATGMDAQLRSIDVIANNMANINTHGFRRDRINFADLFYQSEAVVGSSGPGDSIRPSGIEIGNGVRTVSTQKIFSSGGLDKTGSELDLAIVGDDNAFFRILRANGQVGYTRNGNFTRDSSGSVVTMEGDQLQPNINIPEDSKSIAIGQDGSVRTYDGITPEGTDQGRLTLVRFMNPSGLRPVGDNLFEETPASGTPLEIQPFEQGAGQIRQNYLEHSNVQAVQELITLIQAQRSYEINSNVVRTTDQVLQLANNLRA